MTQEEKQVSKAFRTYWKAHFSRGKGAFEKVLSLWHPDITAIGTGKDEIVKTYNGFIKFLKREFEEVNTTMPVKILWNKVQLLKDQALVLGETEVTVSKENNIKIRFRVSAVFKRQKNKWLLYHIHGSLPASAQRENESFPIDGLIAEKEKLEKEVAEKTADLLNKNRELEIETSLERVRAVAMSMNKSDDLLSICEVSFKEFQKLGFDSLRNTIIHILNDEKGFFMDYDYSDYLGGSINNIRYDSHPIVKRYLGQIKKADDAFAEVVIKSDQLDSWKDFRRRGGQLDDPKLEEISALYYYLYSIGVGDIGISTFKPIDESQIKILKRFRNVFDLAYRRYTDISLAEAQTREAKIQLALEIVRARTMAMQKSEELSETVVVLFQQLNKLGSTPERMNICIIKEDSGLMEVWSTEQDGKQINHSFNAKLSEPTTVSKIYTGWKKKRKSLIINQSGKELSDWIRYLQKEMKMPFRKELRHRRRVHTMAFFSSGCLLISTPEPVSSETINLLERFAAVFDLTYRRFLDLKKAEAQAREADIQLSLERIRAHTMAMNKSTDLKEVIQLLYQEFKSLRVIFNTTAIQLKLDDSRDLNLWSGTEKGLYKELIHWPYVNIPIQDSTNQAWQTQGFQDIHYDKKEKDRFLTEFFKIVEAPEAYKKRLMDTEGLELVGYFKKEVGIQLLRYSKNPFWSEERDIVRRFTNSFEQSHTRFLDLQKAEAQAREAQIEAALERIRSRALGMHHSSEVGEVSNLLYNEFEKMGITLLGFNIIVQDKDKDRCEMWRAKQVAVPNEFESFSIKAMYDKLDHYLPEFTKEFESNWRKGKPYYIAEFKGKNRISFLKANQEIYNYSDKHFQKMKDLYPEPIVFHMIFFKQGWLGVFRHEYLSENDLAVSHRFAEVFEFAYTRFLDLEKAEAQAREAQIEAALERVRSRTMAMHKSEELAEVVVHLFNQLDDLGIKTYRCNVAIVDLPSERIQVWSTTSEGKVIPIVASMPFTLNIHIKKMVVGWKKQAGMLVIKLSGQERLKWTKSINKYMAFAEYKPENIDEGRILKEPAILSNFYFKQGFFILHTLQKLDEFSINIIHRFSKVFEQSYTRFLDLRNAEAQAREAQIEAALEKVRAKAMGMHSSNDISDTMGVVFTELPKLGISSLRCGVVLLSKDSFKGVFYAAATTTESDSQTVIGEGDMSVHPIFMKEREHWTKNENYFVTLSDDDLKSYYKEIFRRSSTPYSPKEHEIQKEHGYYFSFSEGMFYAWSEEPYSESDINILERFKAIIDLTFRRYIDLQKAEAQAREAVKQASLDRVRGEIASMRTSEDLNRITPIMWRELETLEVPFIRCGVFIVDEENEKVRVYLTTPDGKSLGVLTLSFDANELTGNTVKHWKKNQVYKEHWNKKEFINWTRSMIEIGQVQNAETYQGSTSPPESLDLHFVPFTQGMLYVGNVSPLTDEKLELVKTLAEAFSIAYARYEDFKNIEEAKNKIEVTLNELKSTQSQLIHSEKMASLGELTAGIAHEIKNPLNFVTNFSDVSRELLDEMKTELQNKNDEEVLEIIESLKQNLEKINQHGKRADSIVKGMLLHSRGTSGEKMLTDINNLLDEYVNLAYHGMRAQDSEFNITMEKDYDKTLEKINVVPQDISRVFMNIISNACYAAYDKKKTSVGDFKPVLKVSTRNLNGKVEIRISDNGNGIPANILDKIFQPFFTTKPTGEGTGLGLSLSYDIVTKVHGGDIQFESEEGKFTEFIVTIPK